MARRQRSGSRTLFPSSPKTHSSAWALYEKAADWESFAITDGRLVTGQNPASSKAAAEALLKLLA
jgi:putative intracellular protease/amidase